MPNVNTATGEICHAEEDFILRGLIPLHFIRNYRTAADFDGMLGHGWSTSLDMQLTLQGTAQIVFLDSEQTRIPFDLPPLGGVSSYANDTLEAITLLRRRDEFVLTFPDRRRLVFGAVGGSATGLRLTRIEDLNGNAVRLDYDSRGFLFHIRDTLGRDLDLDYYATGRLREIALRSDTGARSAIRLAAYQYDLDGNLIGAADALGHRSTYEYHSHLLVKYVNRLGGACYFSYDSQRRCVQVWRDDAIRLRQFHYDSTARATLVMNALGDRTLYRFNEAGAMTRTTNALGAIRETVYDQDNKIVVETDDGGKPRLFQTYDAAAHELKQINAGGTTTTVTYTELNQIATATDGAGHTWRFRYDERGNLLERVLPLGGRWRYEYDDRGRVVRVSAPTGQTVQISRNQDASAGALTDDFGTITRFRYDYLGRMVELVGPLGHRVRLSYDVLGRALAVEQPDGGVARYAYDADGNLLRYTDESGASTQYEYDGYGICRRKIDALGQVVSYEYDRELNLTAIVNQKGERSVYVYDPLGRVVQRTLFDGCTHRFEYNPKGDLVAVTAVATGNRMVFERNAASQVTRVTCNDGLVAAYDFDVLGRLSSAMRESSTLAWTFDAEDHLVREESDEFILEYAYDTAGRRIAVRDNEGSEVRYEYDLRSRLTKIQTGRPPHVYDYDALDRAVRHRMPNGCEEHLTYDVGGRVASKTIAATDGRVLLQREYRYDSTGRLLELHDQGHHLRYEYDALGRLRAARHDHLVVEEFEYDAADNLIRMSGLTGIQYERGNRLRRAGATTCRYDPYGNLVAKEHPDGDVLFEYGMGTLMRVLQPGLAPVEYRYDPVGRRVVQWRADETKRFVWDQHVLFCEKRSTPGHEERWSYVFLPNSFVPLEVSKGNTSYSYVVDHMGTPTELLDEEGEVVWAAEATAWGDDRSSATPEATNPLRFPGQYRDDTGLHYNRYRYYDPQLGRYLSQDPLGLQGGLNLYRYVADPVNWTDPLGLAALALPPNVVGYAQIPCTPPPPQPPGCPPANPPANPVPNPARGCLNAQGQLRGGGGPPHNQTINQIDQMNGLAGQPGGDFRVNQQQVTATGTRVGRNRPDMQVTINGQRNYIEVDTQPATRAACHASQICGNDPQGVVHLVLI